jgi:site-specific DNA recombinase
MARLIDGYAEGLIEKVEFEPRIKRMKQRVTVLEEQLQQLADEAVQQRELRLLIGQLEEFVTKVQRNLATADWEMKREIIRALVRRVEIDKQEVTVVFRVGTDPYERSPEEKSSQHCWRRALALVGQHCPAWSGGAHQTGVSPPEAYSGGDPLRG